MNSSPPRSPISLPPGKTLAEGEAGEQAVHDDTMLGLRKVSSQPPEPSVVSDPGQHPAEVCFPNSYFCAMALS